MVDMNSCVLLLKKKKRLKKATEQIAFFLHQTNAYTGFTEQKYNKGIAYSQRC